MLNAKFKEKFKRSKSKKENQMSRHSWRPPLGGDPFTICKIEPKIKIKYPVKFLILQWRTKLKIKTKFKSYLGGKRNLNVTYAGKNTKEMQ